MEEQPLALSRCTSAAERQRLPKARAAARKARYRVHLASSGAVLAVPTRDINRLIDALVSLRWLDLSASEDRRAINAAVGALLDDLAERHQLGPRDNTYRDDALR